MPTFPTILEEAQDLQSELIELRRNLHSYPELSFQEKRTTELIGKRLAACGFSLRSLGDTGVVAEIGGGTKIIALRTEMDALPIAESNSVSYASRVPSVMHACGHDANISCIVGAARILARKLRRDPFAKLRIIAQPGGEYSDDDGKTGASRAIEAGALEGVEVVLALHVDTTIKTGAAKILSVPSTSGFNREFNDTADTGLDQSGTADSGTFEPDQIKGKPILEPVAVPPLRRSASAVLGAGKVNIVTRKSWGQDFTLYTDLVPGAVLYLGAMLAGSPRTHHTATFDLDEKCLCLGAAILAEATAILLSS